MAITITSTGITFPDGTQSLPHVATAGSVGAYMFCGSESTFTAVYVPPTAEEIAAQASIDVREIRKQLLETKVNPLVSNPLRWNDLTAEQQASVTAYRQALLDVTDQEGFPMNVVWLEWPLG